MTILVSRIAVCAKGSARRALSVFSDGSIANLSKRRILRSARITSSERDPFSHQNSYHNSSATTIPPLSARWISSTPIRLGGGGELAEQCNQHVISSPFDPIQESWDVPLPDFILSAWKKQKRDDRLAILDGSTGMKRTFGDYCRDTAGIAGSLRYDLDIHRESCVCLFAPNHVDYLPVTLAVGLCGAKITPVNPLYTARELAIVLQKSKTSVLVAHTSNLQVALEAVKEVDCVEHVLVMTEDGEVSPIHGLETLESIKNHSKAFGSTSDAYHCEPGSHPYLLPYSSGTTGLPKGVCLTHSNITVNLLQMEIVEGCSETEIGLVSPLPFFHIYGMVVSMMYYGWKGCPVYTMSGRFDFELLLEMIQTHKPTHAHLVPPIILGLAKSPLVENYDLSSIQSIISAASPLGHDTECAAQNRLEDCIVKQAWGMSELSPIGTFTPNSNQKLGSVGPLVSNTSAKIIDETTGESLGPNKEGELVVKGPQVMMGYLNEQEKTDQCLSSSGWLRTGDLAHYDKEGYFFITDRIKELIKVRGFQVAPAELEDLLLGHEAVNDVAVIQIPDETSGELPLAYIVLKDPNYGDTSEQQTKEEIYEWVKEKVAPYKRLDGGINFVESIPKSASGKILRRILRDELAAQLHQ